MSTSQVTWTVVTVASLSSLRLDRVRPTEAENLAQQRSLSPEMAEGDVVVAKYMSSSDKWIGKMVAWTGK